MSEIAQYWHQVTFVDRVFIFAFVPIAVVLFHCATRLHRNTLSAVVLVAVSLVFYASWGTRFFAILLTSMMLNYGARRIMVALPAESRAARARVLAAIVVGNLGALFAFKYFDLFAGTFAGVAGIDFKPLAVAVPLGMSFYTFQEITIAVDAFRGNPRLPFLKYILFIVFFPHLISGPLVHHREMVPQFERLGAKAQDFLIGVSLFTIGLAKKICIADPLASTVHGVFDAPPGTELQLLSAWAATLAYAFQIYFDFSGYSDMALGLGRLFGIKLPINFYSPYRAENIADFWRRWNMTLSRFLREYVYIPLGGNRHGPVRRDVNLMIVMLVGGLWHGSNWTFVLWGALHGLYLVAHRVFRQIAPMLPVPVVLARLLTFLCVVIAWVPFRAPDFASTSRIWAAMAGFNGIETISVPAGFQLSLAQTVDMLGALPDAAKLPAMLAWLLALYVFCLVLPNTKELLQLAHPWPGSRDFVPAGKAWLYWRPVPAWGAALGVMFGVAMLVSRQVPQEFLYWKF